MSAIQELNDPNKTCILLPAPEHPIEQPPPPPVPGDLPGGYDLRLSSYKRAWKTCLDRMQTVIRDIHAPVVSAVSTSVRTAYAQSHTLPGLPYTELPVVVVSAPGGNHTIISDVVHAIDGPIDDSFGADTLSGKGKERVREDDEEEGRLAHGGRVASGGDVMAHVHSADCPNLMSAMKTIITGFVDCQPEDADKHRVDLPPAVKRKPTASLASYDMNLLEAWYTALLEQRDKPPRLVIVVYDFEKMDPGVMQDVFYICSQHIPRLPLVFLLALSTPSASSYLQSAFPRACLALLRVHHHTVPSGVKVLEEMIQKTFFDVDFKPDITIGSGTLDFLADFCSRHTASIDAMLTILQVAHLKHFEEPLTVLVHDGTLGGSSEDGRTLLSQPSSFDFLDTLLTRVWSELTPDVPTGGDDSRATRLIDNNGPSIETLLQVVEDARSRCHQRAVQMRLGYQLIKIISRFMQEQGYKTLLPGPELEFMSAAVQGRARDANYLVMAVKYAPHSVPRDNVSILKQMACPHRNLSRTQLEALLSDLYSFFYNLQSHPLRHQEAGARDFITQTRSRLSRDREDRMEGQIDTAGSVASDVGEWLRSYLEERMTRLDDGLLWEIWNTGATPFPSEIINPAPRMSIINALLHPYDVINAHKGFFGADAATGVSDELIDGSASHKVPLWALPDTSILFRRYMEAGKMINVYDWFESFGMVLDSQRRSRSLRQRTSGGSPQKRRREDGEDASEEEMDEEEEEKWKSEVQARFIRALHELDYMGFIKHTGRKADHVLRTIYDVLD